MCGSCANEGALKAAFMAYRARERGQAGQMQDFTPDEVNSVRTSLQEVLSCFALTRTPLPRSIRA